MKPRQYRTPPQNPWKRRDTPTILKGKRIDLENGDYVIVVDVLDSEMVETKAWFDEEGKAHIRCNH